MDKLIEMTITVLVVVISLRLAWEILQPLLPALAISSVVVGMAVVVVRWRRRYW